LASPCSAAFTIPSRNDPANTGAARLRDLYTISSNQRATAKDAKRARGIIEKAKREGKIGTTADISEEAFLALKYSEEEAQMLAESYRQNQVTINQINDESVLSGFGNNGGEEFLSYMMTSESMIITGGTEWENWNQKMHQRLAKIQNGDGSWNGHHCITSPVFCTAAVILTLSTENEKEFLMSGIGD